MLPDFADSHAFAYIHAWEKEGDTDSHLIRSHIAGHWWMHFGDDLTRPARRRGTLDHAFDDVRRRPGSLQAHGEEIRAVREFVASVEHERFRTALPGPPLKTHRALLQQAAPSTGAKNHVAA